MDDKNKKKIRFNVVDVLIIVLVLAAVAVVGYVLLTERNDVAPQSENVKINYVLMVSEAQSAFADNVKVGDEVYEQESGKYIGKVVQVSSTVAKKVGTDRKTGEQVISELANRRDIFVTVEADAERSDNLYIVSGINIIAGGVLSFMTPGLMQPSNIISVERVQN